MKVAAMHDTPISLPARGRSAGMEARQRAAEIGYFQAWRRVLRQTKKLERIALAIRVDRQRILV
jgi:hypothetical protein